MPSICLTNKSLKALSSSTEAVYWDKDLPGFGVKVYPTGRKTYLVKYRSAGKQVVKHLPGAHLMSLDSARSQARSILLDAAISAEDEPLPMVTFAEFAPVYMERHAKIWKAKSWKADEQRLRDWLVPKLGKMRLDEIRRRHILALHAEIGKEHPTLANRLRELLVVLFKNASLWEYLPENHPNPALGIRDFPERKVRRWLRDEELARLGKVLKFYRNRYMAAAIYFSIYTGKRKMEVLTLKWEDVDLKNEVAYIENVNGKGTKNGDPTYVHLAAPLLEVLKQLKRLPGNPYVFCGKLPGKPLLSVDKLWYTIRKRAGIEDVRFHDLRHTAASHLIQAGVAIETVGEFLGHKSKDATWRYAHHDRKKLKVASDQYAAHIVEYLPPQV